MKPPAPYGPDRSLVLAIAVLGCVLVLGAGGVYLVSTLTTGGLGGSSVARAPALAPSSPAVAPRGIRPSFGARRSAGPGPAGSGVPAWADGGRTASPSAPASRSGGYDLRADLGAADLGSPAAPTPSYGAAPSGRMSPAGGAARSSGGASFSVDLGGSGSGGASWTSELSQLNGRLRALDGALAQLDRTPRAVTGSSPEANASERGSQASGGESAAATSNATAPSMPGDPSQVPVDGGLGWLAAAGAAYAVRRLRASSESPSDAS